MSDLSDTLITLEKRTTILETPLVALEAEEDRVKKERNCRRAQTRIQARARNS